MMNQSRSSDSIQFCYEWSSRSCVTQDYSIIAYASLCLLLVIIIILTVFGNLLVIITIAHCKQLRTPTNYLILSLAVTDFLVGAVIMPPSAGQTLEICWFLSNMFCNIHTSTEIMLCNISILNLSLISIDRYYAVCQPLRYQTKITNSVTVTMILTCWLFSAALGYGVVFLKANTRGLEDIYNESVNCTRICPRLDRRESSVLFSVLAFFLPALLITVLYLKVITVARRQASSIHSRVCAYVLEKSTTTLNKTEPKATRTLGTVVGIYFVCWAPWFLGNLINPAAAFSSATLLEVLTWLAYLNSAVNPIIYAFSFSWFRKPFKRVFQKNITF